MRNVVIVLALTTAAFAGSTVYFAHQLSVERDRAASAVAGQGPASGAVTAAAPALGTSDAAGMRAATETGAAEPPKANARTAMVQSAGAGEFVSGAVINGQPVSEADMKKMQADYSKRFLAQLADPEQREELLAERKVMIRGMYPRIDQVLDLSPEEYARFIELSALAQVDMQESSSRCALDPDCHMHDVHRNLGQNRNQEINNLLGAERMQKFETYKNTMGERESVVQLRNRLPDTQRLGDDTAEALINALAEERNAMHREAVQQGVGTSGFGFGAGMIYTSGDGSFEERYEIAKQNSQRLRDRAAQHLNAAQLRTFNEMQDETLLSLRGALRQKDNMNVQDGISFSAVATPTVPPN